MHSFGDALTRRLPQSCAASKLGLLTRVRHAWGPGEPDRAFWVPGRIEILGKHTDYCGGRSLLAAAGRGFVFGFSPRKDLTVRICDAVSGERLESHLSPDVSPRIGLWSNYPETVIRRIARNFPGDLCGADVVFASDLPPAAGMSSSSALMVGFFLVLDSVNRLTARPEYLHNIRSAEDLSGYLGTLENGQTFGSLVGDRGVGTFGGSEDHTAIVNCQAGRLSQYAYCPVTFERVMGLPPEMTLAIGVSGVVAEKTGTAMEKYNRASRLAFTALSAWNALSGKRDPHLAAAIRSHGVEEIRAQLNKATDDEFSAEDLVRRFDHFAIENERLVSRSQETGMPSSREISQDLVPGRITPRPAAHRSCGIRSPRPKRWPIWRFPSVRSAHRLLGPDSAGVSGPSSSAIRFAIFCWPGKRHTPPAFRRTVPRVSFSKRRPPQGRSRSAPARSCWH